MKLWWTTTSQLAASDQDGYPPRLYRDQEAKTFHEGNRSVRVVLITPEELREEKRRAFEAGRECNYGCHRLDSFEDYEATDRSNGGT